MTGPNYPLALNRVLHIAVRERIAEIGAHLASGCQWTVQSGPFAGMRLPSHASWGEGDITSKLLGCYEQELAGAIERAIAREPDVVVNVGCAEGFYAVGLARRLPNARVHAFDIDPAAQAVCASAAVENGVGDRLTTAGRCDADQLIALGATAERLLIVMDCEGAELDLLSEAAVQGLPHADVIVECHDFADRSITPTLTGRLQATHAVESLREGPRDPAGFPVLRGLGSFDRWLTVCEFRPEVMTWLTAWSQQARPGA